MTGKVALVTGAGSGIGRASALMFSREGAQVVVVDADSSTASETFDLIHEAGGESVSVVADVCRAEDCRRMVREAVSLYGRIDCAHNNAGILGAIRIPFHEYPDDDWNRVVDVNLKGLWLCMKAEPAQMPTQGDGGLIVNASSVSGVTGFGPAPYVARKH